MIPVPILTRRTVRQAPVHVRHVIVAGGVLLALEDLIQLISHTRLIARSHGRMKSGLGGGDEAQVSVWLEGDDAHRQHQQQYALDEHALFHDSD